MSGLPDPISAARNVLNALEHAKNSGAFKDLNWESVGALSASVIVLRETFHLNERNEPKPQPEPVEEKEDSDE